MGIHHLVIAIVPGITISSRLDNMGALELLIGVRLPNRQQLEREQRKASCDNYYIF
jgi:hypothetical protein